MHKDISTLSQRQIIKHSSKLNVASYRLSELSLNIIMTLISEIKNEETDFKTYTFSISDLEKKIGKKIDRSYIDIVSDELLKNIIKIPKEDDKGFLKTCLISSFEYFKYDGVFKISFDPKLKPYLLSVKQSFVLGYLKEFVEIKGEYAKRIYMLLRENSYKGIFNIEVDFLKNILVVPKSMDEYKVFKRRVLNHAVNQINTKTSLIVSFEEIRTGRNITNINFTIKKRFEDAEIIKDTSNPIKEWCESEDIKISSSINKTITWANGDK